MRAFLLLLLLFGFIGLLKVHDVTSGDERAATRMSKAQAKASKAKPSKDLKGKPNQAEKQLYSLFEIVPGKFNENDW